MQAKRNIMINKAGGTAGKNSVNYRLSIPADMVRAIGANEDDRSVLLRLEENRIVIEKAAD